MHHVNTAYQYYNINTAVEEHVSSENIHFDIFFVDIGIPSTLFNKPLKNEFIEEVILILPKVSKLNVSVMKKTTTNVFGEKTLI